MKKLLLALVALLMVFTLVGCASNEEPEPTVEEPEVQEYDYSAKSEGVLTYEEYAAVAADGSTEVVVEAYVQAAQSYWNGATIYLQDPDGAYFVYGGQISEEDYAKIVTSTDYKDGWYGQGTGVKVKVTGTKAEWSGEVELTDATVEIVDEEHTWLAEAADVSTTFGSDTLTDHANQLIKVTGTIAASTNAAGEEVAYLYNWDGSGEEGSDLYYNVEINGNTYAFCVESYLCYAGSDVYEAVKALNVGDAVTLTGFLYWYEGPQVHTVAVAK